MKRRRIMLVIAGIALAAVVAILVWPGEKEPKYQGKTLSEWLAQHDDAAADSPEENAAAEAIRAMGTNAVSCLLNWIQYETPGWRTKLDDAIDKLPDSIGSSPVVEHVTKNRSDERADWALLGFTILGGSATSAVPRLARMLDDPKRPETSGRALSVLPELGKEGVAVILRRMASADPEIRIEAMNVIASRTVGSNGIAAVPILLRALEGTNSNESSVAARALGELKLQPEVVVPALVLHFQRGSSPALEHGLVAQQYDAMTALTEFGPAARPALPLLQEIAKDRDHPLYAEARALLTEIAEGQKKEQ